MQAFAHVCPHASHYYALQPLAVEASESVAQFLGWLQVEYAQGATKSVARLCVSGLAPKLSQGRQGFLWRLGHLVVAYRDPHGL